MNFEPGTTFTRNHILDTIKPNTPEEERLALQYMNRDAPDLVGMVLGGVL